MDDDVPYLLLTPGPLTTSPTVKRVMLRDYCTWDDDYNQIVSEIRNRVTRIAAAGDDYTCALMQGSGTFAVEATIGSVIPPDGKLLYVNNGAYGKRIGQIASRLKIATVEVPFAETSQPDLAAIEAALRSDPAVTHVAAVHCETTTGMLNPAAAIGELAKRYDKLYIVDAMSSLGGIPLTMQALRADYLVSSANKCIQGVPGFGLIICRRAPFAQTKGWARSLSLDLYDQWREMEDNKGKWRYTSPTHVVRAFRQALDELDAEGGVAARHQRYQENHRILVAGMEGLGFRCLLEPEDRSPFITSFLYPSDPQFSFNKLYDAMKQRGFVIYPGKISQADTFRIGTIGHVFPDDFRRLIGAMDESLKELNIRLR